MKPVSKRKTSNPNAVTKLNQENGSERNIPPSEVKVYKWLEDYLDLQSFRMKPFSEASIERIAQELIDWSAKEDSIVFRDFYDDRFIPETTYYRWVEKYQPIKDAHILAKGRIGSRREKGALGRKYDPSFIANSMPMYDSEWKNMITWKSSLKEQSSNNQPITINLPNITTQKEEQSHE